MNRELHERLLAELSRPGLRWKLSPNHEAQEQGTVRWLPIADVTAARIELGLSSDARWVRATPHSVTVFSPDKPSVFLLPALEVGLQEMHSLLKRGLLASGLSPEFLKVFPFEDIAVTGLKSHSEHWTGLALKWVEQMPASSKFQEPLQTLRNSGPTQKIRHTAQKLLAGQRRSGEEKRTS